MFHKEKIPDKDAWTENKCMVSCVATIINPKSGFINMPYKDKKKARANQRKNYHKRLMEKRCIVCGARFTGKRQELCCNKHRHGKGVSKKVKRTPIVLEARVCDFCERVFFIEKYKKNKCCSKECASGMKFLSFAQPKIKFKCDNCGKVVFRVPAAYRGKNHFCSRACHYEFKTGKPNLKIRGKKHPHWKDGKRRRKTTSLKYKKWRDGVYQRDDYRCCFCGSVDNLAAHHIVAWADSSLLRFYKTNGMTLCGKCHNDIHDGNFIQIDDRFVSAKT